MPQDDVDLLTPDTGLKEDFDGTIFAAEWVANQKGNYSLTLRVLADDDDEVEIRLNLGPTTKNWTSYDGGETVTNQSSNRGKFHLQSDYFRWLAAASKAGAEEEIRERGRKRFDGAGQGPRHAALWLGLKFHFDVVNEPGRRSGEDGVWKDVEIPAIRPTKYLGSGEEEEKETPAPKARKTPPASRAQTNSPPSTSVSPHANGPEISSDDLAILRQLAGQAADYESFADTVMETEDSDGVVFVKNRAVMTAMADESWFEGLKS